MVLLLGTGKSVGTHPDREMTSFWLQQWIQSAKHHSNGSPKKADRSINIEVRAGEGHLSYSHIEEIIEIIGWVGIRMA